MKKFSDFAKEETIIDGDKVKIESIIDKEIEVLGYKLTNSKYKPTEQCLTIHFKIDGETHVVFTGSSVLIEQCEQYKDEMPFFATIKRVNKHYTFS